MSDVLHINGEKDAKKTSGIGPYVLPVVIALCAPFLTSLFYFGATSEQIQQHDKKLERLETEAATKADFLRLVEDFQEVKSDMKEMRKDIKELNKK